MSHRGVDRSVPIDRVARHIRLLRHHPVHAGFTVRAFGDGFLDKYKFHTSPFCMETILRCIRRIEADAKK